MLRRYSIDVTFGRPVVVYESPRRTTREQICDLLNLQPYSERDKHMLVRNMGIARNHVVAMFDPQFYENRQFVVASNDVELLKKADTFAVRLYELSPHNYDQVERNRELQNHI